MERFSTKLQYNLIDLTTAPSIVMTSFISHKTISHLNLQLCERTLAFQKESLNWLIYPFSSIERSFFCTIESLRNNLVPERRLLCTLHLDLPYGREYSNLGYGQDPESFSKNSESLFVVVRDSKLFYCRVVSELVSAAFEQTYKKFKLLKWIVNFQAVESFWLPRSIQLFYAKLLYRECEDSEFAMKCFGKFIELSKFSTTEELKVLEYLLRHARLCDFDIRRQTCRTSLTDYYIESLNFRNVESILKYEGRNHYTEESYNFYKKQLWWRGCDWNKLKEPENRMSKLRLYRILQIFFVSGYKCSLSVFDPHFPVQASEALRLVWSSIPDSFVCLEEMNAAYGNVLPAKAISESYSYYEEAIRQTDLHREPRLLSQYCRLTIRKSLVHNRRWLPDGIEQLKLPSRLEAFLNLQIDSLHPENFQGA